MRLCDDRTQPGYGAIRIETGALRGIGLMDDRTGFSDAHHFLGGVPPHPVEVAAVAPRVVREPGLRHIPARRHTGAAVPSRENR